MSQTCYKSSNWQKHVLRGEIHNNGFLNAHMDYNVGSALAFQCIFGYDFISIFVIRIQYMIHDGPIDMDWKKIQQKI